MRQLLARRRGRSAGVFQHRLCLPAEAGALSQSGRSGRRPAEKVTFFARSAFPQRRNAIPLMRDFSMGGITMNETFAAWTPRALSVLRIVTGLLIIQHGMGKLLG